MPPDPHDVMESAASRGWEAALVVFIVIATLFAMGWVFRFIIQKLFEREAKAWDAAEARETRLADRIGVLEDLINTLLMERLDQNTKAMGSLEAAISTLSAAISTRPCMWEAEQQTELLAVTLKRLQQEMRLQEDAAANSKGKS